MSSRIKPLGLFPSQSSFLNAVYCMCSLWGLFLNKGDKYLTNQVDGRFAHLSDQTVERVQISMDNIHGVQICL